MTQFLHLADNDFKVAIIHLLREPKKKKKVFRELKEHMAIMREQIVNL